MSGAGKLPTIDYKAIYARVSANRDRLDNCPRHLFEDLVVVPRQIGQKAECSVCKGQMDLVAINYYVRGYVASGKPGNDVVPGWTEPGTDETPKRAYFKPSE